MYLEPETPEGRRVPLHEGNERIRHLAPDRIDALREAARAARATRLDANGAARLCTALLERAGLASAAAAPLDERIAAAVARLRSDPRERRSLAALARTVGLSPSRFRHLFFDQMGISCRRYVLWLRLLDAIEASSRGASPTQAAQEAGFSDSAHLARTFRRMLGIPPSAVVRSISSMA
jgi:AraC-like DNA-binding protein